MTGENSEMRIVAITLILLGTFSSACSDSNRILALQKRVDDLESQVKTLKSSVETIEIEQKLDKFLRDTESVAYLTPGSEGYSIIETDLGRVTLMLVNVEPYANGTRVTLRFGNLMSATINGAKATLEWGSVDEKGSPKNESARSREIKFVESLRAGAWTNVQVVLEGVPPSAFGFVRVKEMTHTGIILAR